MAYSAAGASLYQGATAGTTAETPAADGATDAPKSEDAVEADYEIVDDAPKS